MNAVCSSFSVPTNAYNDVYEQFSETASFLWILRSHAVNRPHYTQSDIVELDNRIEAQIDGLMMAPEDSWAICRPAMESGDPGDIFVGSMVAFRSLDVAKIQHAVEVGLSSDQTLPPLVSALGWLPGRITHSWIKRFLTSKDLGHKYLSVAVCGVRREDPGDYLANILQRQDCLDHSVLYARSLRLIGELKRRDLMPVVRHALRSDDADIRFWALWAAILLGDKSITSALRPYVMEPNRHRDKAIQLAFRVLSVEEGRRWINSLVSNPDDIRDVIKAAGILGDPHAVAWLIGNMRVPMRSRLAGEAFTLITGVDLETNNLALKDLPNLDKQFPNDDPEDNNVDIDEDDDLPFPDADKVAAVWHKYQHRLTPGKRFFLGKQIHPQHLSLIVASGYQRQRRAAAFESALLDPGQLLQNWKARDRAD